MIHECPKCHHEFEQYDPKCKHKNKVLHPYLPQWECLDCDRTFITLPMHGSNNEKPAEAG